MIENPVMVFGQSHRSLPIVFGTLTFIFATMGVNVVANFIPPCLDFSNVSPQLISVRTGGMIAAVGSVLFTPWNVYRDPEALLRSLDVLSCFTGPIFGIILA